MGQAASKPESQRSALKAAPIGPPDPDEIGRAGWTILHTTAAAFPNAPTPKQQAVFRSFIASWSHVYPCSVCAYHMRRELERRGEIPAANKREASRFVCELHNSVNVTLGKPTFDCDPDKVLAAWHPGYPDHMQDEPSLEEQLAAAAPPPLRQAEPSHAAPRSWRPPGAAPGPPIDGGKVADDETDTAAVLARLKGCQTFCPDKSLENLLSSQQVTAAPGNATMSSASSNVRS